MAWQGVTLVVVGTTVDASRSLLIVALVETGTLWLLGRLGLTMPLVPVRNPKQPRLQQPIVNLTQGS